MYLTLPSNSSQSFFPSNEAGHFITQLPQTQTLSDDYEVGLTEIQFSNNYQNVTKATFKYTETHTTDILNAQGNKQGTRTKTEGEFIEVPNGLYESNGNFIEVLNQLADHHLEKFCWAEKQNAKKKKKKLKNKNPIKFKYNSYTKRVSVFLYKKNAKSQLILSDALKEILGFNQDMLTGKRLLTADRAMDLDQRVKSIFVYTDLVQRRPVGDAVVPLLRTLPPVDKSKETMHYLFEKPHYMSLSRFQFDTVEILLTSDRGEPISFDSGHTIATLHFRRKRIV